jgi:nicotinate-nucleotide adenylyltransferase
MDLKPHGSGVGRLGVFGGAFDPPHDAHAALVRSAIQSLDLDELRIVPTGHAWHKTRVLTAVQHRLNMAKLAFGNIDRAVVDPIEALRIGPSFTIDTLHEFKTQHPCAELFLIMGQDQAEVLKQWHSWQEILQLAIICVAEREVLTKTDSPFTPLKGYETRFRSLPVAAMSVSATEIRARVARQQSIAPLVFEPVARYIDDYHLYQTI